MLILCGILSGLNTLWLQIMAPERVDDMVTALVQMYEEGGWIPKWPNPTYTNIMIGTHADAVIADAYINGFRDYDVEKAYEAIRKDAYVPPTDDSLHRWGTENGGTADMRHAADCLIT